MATLSSCVKRFHCFFHAFSPLPYRENAFRAFRGSTLRVVEERRSGAIAEYGLDEAAQRIWDEISSLNQEVAQRKPWEILMRNPQKWKNRGAA